MTKKEIIKLTESINIITEDWKDEVSKHLTDYQRGYFDATCSQLGESLCSYEEEYREEILELLDWLLS